MHLNTVSKNPIVQMQRPLFTGASRATSTKRHVAHGPTSELLQDSGRYLNNVDVVERRRPSKGAEIQLLHKGGV